MTEDFEDSTVFVVDDDTSVRKSLRRLITAAGWTVETFASADDFLDRSPHDRPACLILDVRMPGLNGIDLQTRLAQSDSEMPIVFITGHGDIPMSVRAMQAGAIDFLPKPFEDKVLLDAIARGIEHDRTHRDEQQRLKTVRARVQSLTRREHEVFDLVVTGLLNKQVAAQLGISEKTVKVHRARVVHEDGRRVARRACQTVPATPGPDQPPLVLTGHSASADRVTLTTRRRPVGGPRWSTGPETTLWRPNARPHVAMTAATITRKTIPRVS